MGGNGQLLQQSLFVDRLIRLNLKISVYEKYSVGLVGYAGFLYTASG